MNTKEKVIDNKKKKKKKKRNKPGLGYKEGEVIFTSDRKYVIKNGSLRRLKS